ncbi:MAG: GNAT family N-acetyltransferase [Planctomycetota bacterium]
MPADAATDVQVRPATVQDLDAVAEMFDHYRVFYGQDSDLDLARRFLGERMEAGESRIYVGQCSEQICGFMQLYPSFSSTAARRIWVLNDLWVEDSARQSGVGQALLKQADQLAVESGASHLELATARDNQPARELYEKQGWVRDDVFVHYYRSPQA